MFLNVGNHNIQNSKSIKILGDELLVKGWDELALLEIDKLFDQAWRRDRQNPILKQPDKRKGIPNRFIFQPFLMKVDSHNLESALDLAAERLEILRSSINMSLIFGKFHLHRPESIFLSKIMPSPIYGVFDDLGRLKTTGINRIKFNYRRENIKSIHKDDISLILSLFCKKTKRTSINTHLLGLAKLYQEYLDMSSLREAYLSLWQVLESSVTFGNETLRHGDMVSRISTLLDLESDQLISEALELLLKLRNRLVHSGEYLARGYDVLNTLKYLVEACIREQIYLAKEYSTINEIQEYLRFKKLGDSDLRRKVSVIESILNSR